MKIKKILYAILVLIWMVTVFSFSSQNGEESQSTSDVFTNWIVKVFNIDKRGDSEYIKETISFAVRKIAHFSIYFVGGFCIYGFFSTFSLDKKQIIIYTILFGFVYACFDEFHQSFVSERSGQVRDVFIDSLGVCLISLIMGEKKDGKCK